MTELALAMAGLNAIMDDLVYDKQQFEQSLSRNDCHKELALEKFEAKIRALQRQSSLLGKILRRRGRV